MLAMVLWIGLYAVLIFWSFEAAYVVWRMYRNNALPRFRFRRKSKLSR
jgi:hypothetical protein